MNTQAALASAARRLRFLRSHPVEPYRKNYTQAENQAASFAYEYALILLIDEFGEADKFHAFFYGNEPGYETCALNCGGV